MGQMTINIPTITLAIMASRMMGYPVMSENDLLRIIHDTPTTELVLNDGTEENELTNSKVRNLWKGTSIDRFSGCTSLNDAIYGGKLLDWMNDKSDKEAVYRTAREQLIDVDVTNGDELIYGTLLKYFGLYDSGDENNSGLKNTMTYREFINMLSKSYKGSEKLIERIMRENYIRDLERKFDKKINYLEMLHLTVAVYMERKFTTADLSGNGMKLYSELIDDYGYNLECVTSLFIAVGAGIIEEIRVNELDRRVTCMDALKVILDTLKIKISASGKSNGVIEIK